MINFSVEIVLMKLYLIILVALLFVACQYSKEELSCQEDFEILANKIADANLENGRYNDKLNQYAHSKVNMQPYDLQGLSQFLSKIGFVECATCLHDETLDYPLKDVKANNLALENFSSFLNPRLDTIDVLMLNEAHHNPSHRAFLASQLQYFYDMGFRQLAMESLHHEDIHRLNQEKIPTRYSATYITEPKYAQLVRQALKIGFTLHAYESEGNTSDFNERDLAQAKNVASIYNDTKGKLLVYAGFGHIREQGKKERYSMAYQFKKLTGVNPFTIDQTVLNQRCLNKTNINYHKLANKIHEPKLLVRNGQPFVLEDYAGFVDAQIIHPKHKFNEYRIAIYENETQSIEIEDIDADCGLVQLYSKAELQKYDINTLIPLIQFVPKQANYKVLYPSIEGGVKVVCR